MVRLKSHPNWVAYKLIPDTKSHSGFKKIPINPKTLTMAKSNDSSTWATYDVAKQAVADNPTVLSGVGFMFSNSPFFGVDIDDVPEELEAYINGNKNNIVGEFIEGLKSYAEYSVSGTGVHIICEGELPAGARRKGSVEMYDTGRFFCVSEMPCSEYTEVKNCANEIKPLHAKYLAGSSFTFTNNSNKFDDLMNGEWQKHYNSQSEADLALCNMLAQSHTRDEAKRIFESSGLMREKWTELRSGRTYGDITLDKAFEGKPAKRISYTLDDMGNARRFEAQNHNVARYSKVDKKWYYYKNNIWNIDSTGVIDLLADKCVENMATELAEKDDEDVKKAFEKHIKKSRSYASHNNMLAMAQHLLSVHPSQFDKDIMLFNTPTCVYDFQNNKKIESSHELYLTKTANVTAEAGTPTEWLKFINTIFDGDEELIEYIQKALGYSLTGDMSEQCAFICFGDGRNGKSTFFNVVAEIVGNYAITIQPETISAKQNNSGATSDIARMKGARICFSTENDEGLRFNEGLLKQITGGDTVTARRLYGEEFEFKPQCKIWMATNHKPIIRGKDEGIWRRIRLIPFKVKIPESEVDYKLPQKLRAEYPKILWWMLQGLKKWLADGLKGVPHSVREGVESYRSEMDVIMNFIDQECEVGESFKAQSSAIYKAYALWCKENNEHCYSSTKFGIELSKQFQKTKSKRGMWYQGIKLNFN